MSSLYPDLDDVEASNSRRVLEHHVRNEIRKLSNDLFSRLHSIAEDAKFVEKIHEVYPNYPVVENLRCGAWYVKPTIQGDTIGNLINQRNRASAYFKSADGHYNAWTFNLRRPNIHILPFIVMHCGVIIVDSTRSGKRVPDALSKTVPIWCAVVNRAVQLRASHTLVSWDTKLYTPPEAVSRQEHLQIETKIEEWANALAASSYEIPQLTKPIRPIWVTPATRDLPVLNEDAEFHPIICLSVSKVVHDGLERRELGYTYVQGAGDDQEAWSLGLTPTVFWKFRDEILDIPQDEMDDFVSDLVRREENQTRSNGQTQKLPTRIHRVSGAIALSSNYDISLDTLSRKRLAQSNDYCYLVINWNFSEETSDLRGVNCCFTRINVEEKVGGESLARQLPSALRFVQGNLSAGRSVCISCDTGSNLSAVVALAALQSFFDDEGRLVIGGSSTIPQADKRSIKKRLEWIIDSRPEANPSRTALKRLNEFFMSRPR